MSGVEAACDCGTPRTFQLDFSSGHVVFTQRLRIYKKGILIMFGRLAWSVHVSYFYNCDFEYVILIIGGSLVDHSRLSFSIYSFLLMISNTGLPSSPELRTSTDLSPTSPDLPITCE